MLPDQTHHLNAVRPSVRPVQVLVDPVEGEAIWSVDGFIDDGFPILLLHLLLDWSLHAVQVRRHDFLVRDVRPEELLIPVVEVQGDGAAQSIDHLAVVLTLEADLAQIVTVRE